MNTTSAVFLTNGLYVLGCHNTGVNDERYDLPKGLMEEGETPIETAVRELFEETGIEIDKSCLTFIGIVPYNYKKNIALNLCVVSELPELNTLKCESMFTNYDDVELPEIDGYGYFLVNRYRDYLRARMCKAIEMSHIIDILKEEIIS